VRPAHHARVESLSNKRPRSASEAAAAQSHPPLQKVSDPRLQLGGQPPVGFGLVTANVNGLVSPGPGAGELPEAPFYESAATVDERTCGYPASDLRHRRPQNSRVKSLRIGFPTRTPQRSSIDNSIDRGSPELLIETAYAPDLLQPSKWIADTILVVAAA